MPSRSTVETAPAAPQELHVCLLGPPRVEWGGAALSVPRRQVRALLYRLAAQPEPLSREQLCFLFWPDVADSDARRSLSGLLAHLRRALPDPDLLLTSGERVGLDPDRVSSDLFAFTRFSHPNADVESLRRAAELYGGPFLAGVSLPGSPEFETWLVQRQRECERTYLSVLTALIERYTARQELDAAIVHANLYLATDDLAEGVHRQLIALYAAAGDRGAAAKQFERCAAVLERELGVRPLPETRAVYEAALQEQETVGTLQPGAPDLSWATLPGLDVPLVGRDATYAKLSEVLSQAEVGRGRVVLISGEPGIGKSRLMEEFATRSADRALVLAAAARSGEERLPYQPVVELFRSIRDWRVFTSSMQPVWLAEAARLLPELRDLCPDLPPPLQMEPDEARARLLEALCRLALQLTGGSRPLLLCLDDLHWADSATLDWLVCLARRMARRSGERRPVLILGTYRTAEQGGVDELRHNLVRLGVLSELRLTGLESTAVLDVVHHLIGSRPGAQALSERLHGVTGGNPFFLLETLRVLLEVGELPEDLAALEEVPLPDTVRQAVEARLRRLDPQTRQALEAGAILGTSFEFDLVRRAAGRGELEAVYALDHAVARQLLVERSTGYHFQHALIRQAVEGMLGPLRRQLLHRRAARALERLDPQPAARIARHFDLAGEEERALRYYRRAARQASDLFAWREAEESQSRMLMLLDRLDPDRSRPEYLALRGDILTSRAHARFLQGRLEDRDADLATLTSLAEGSGDQELSLQVLVHRVRYLNLDAKYEEALHVAEEGLALAELLDRAGTASRLLAQIGFAHYFLGQPQPALSALESALASMGDEGSPAMRGRISHIMGYVYFHLGDYSRSLKCQQEAYACHQAVGDQNRVAWDGLDIGALHLELGEIAVAKRYLTEHLDLARRIGARPAEAYGLTLLGSWELHRGAYLRAVEGFQEAGSLHHRLESEHGIVATELGAGLALYHLGDLAQGRYLLQKGIQRARSIAHRRRLAESLVALGLLETRAHSTAAAHSSLTEAVAMARDAECCESIAAGCSALARLERIQGNQPGALECAREALEVARRRELLALEVWAHMETGLALLAQGQPDQALEHTTRALDGLPRTREAWIGTEEIHRAHGEVLRALGRIEEAREHARLAAAAIQAKADLIPDPEARHRYLQHVRPETSHPIT
ncbi:MAG: ATP-binding protein [Chloroflexota bacterium]